MADEHLGIRFDADISDLLNKIKKLEATLKETKESFEKTGQSLSGAFSTVPEQLAEIANAIKQQTQLMNENQQNLAKTITQTAESISAVGNAINEQEQHVERGAKATRQFADENESSRARLREMREELVRLREQGIGPEVEAYRQLEDEAAKLQDAMDDATRGIKKQSSDTRSLDNVINLAQSAASAVGLYQSALVAMGADSEEAAEATSKLMAVMTTIQSLQQLQNTLMDNATATYRVYHKFLQLVGIEKKAQVATTTAQTTATVAETVATTAATKAQWSFNAAMLANPLIAFLALITAVVAAIWGLCKAFSTFISKEDEAKESCAKLDEASKKLNKTIEERKSALSDLISYYRTLGETEVQLAKREEDAAEKNVQLMQEQVDKAIQAKREWEKSAWWHSDDTRQEFDQRIAEAEKGLKKEQDVYTSAQNKTNDEIEKEKQQTSKRRKEARNASTQAEIDAMKDGLEKELAQAKHNFNKRKDQLEEQIKEAKKYNDQASVIEYEYQQKRAKTAYNNEVIEIQKKYNDKLAEQQKKRLENERKYLEELRKIKDEIAKAEVTGKSDYEKKINEENYRYNSELNSLDKDEKNALATANSKSERKTLKNLYAKRREQLKEEHEKLTKDINDWSMSEVNSVLQGVNEVMETDTEKQLDAISKKYANNLDKLYQSGQGKKGAEEYDKIETARRIETVKAFYDQEIKLAEEDATAKKEELAVQLEQEKITERQYQQQLLLIEAEERQDKIATLETVIKELQELGANSAYIDEFVKKLNKLTQAEDKATASTDKATKQLSKNNWNTIAQGVANVTSQFKDLDTTAGNVTASVGGLFDTMVEGFNKEAIDSDDTEAKIQAYASAAENVASAVVSLYNAVKAQKKANKELKDSYQEALQSAQHQAALSRIANYEYEESLFGNDDPYEKAITAVNKYKQAQKELLEYSNQLANGRVQTGTATATDWGKVAETAVTTGISGAAAGAVIGAAIGTAAGPIGTAIGAAVGVIAGALVAYFGSAEEEYKVYSTLQNKYGSLYDKDTLELNQQIIDDYDLLDDKTKQMVDNWEDIKNEMQEAKDTLEETITDLAGDITDNLSESLVEAFAGGNTLDAIDDFKDYITDKLKQLYMSQIMSNIFGKEMEELQASMESSMGLGDGVVDGSWIDDLETFFANMPELMEQADTAMANVQRIAENAGYDLFGTSTSDQNAISGAVSSMSEETADALNGNFLGLKLTAMEINSQMQEANSILNSSLSVQRQIANNTAFCEKLVEIENAITHIDRVGVQTL